MEDQIKFWINDLLEALESQVGGETVKRVLEQCGIACVRRGLCFGVVEEVKNNAQDLSDIDGILDLMNQRRIGGGKLYREDNVIFGSYEECNCPVRKKVTSPAFCYCTTGWAKEVFETVLEHPVDVELVEAIGRGDEVCTYRVTIL